MPYSESYRSYLDTPSDRWKEVPKAVRNLYCDERAFQLYQAFKDVYAGDPYKATHPEIIRERAGRVISYEVPVLSAITTNGKHLICIRAGHAVDVGQGNANETAGLDARLQFFVVTADFETFDTTEWLLSDVRSGSVGQPKSLELVLQHPDTELTNNSNLHTVGSHPFDELDFRDDTAQARADADASAMKVVYENQQAHLTWGDGAAPSKFRSFREVEGDLYLLHRAEAAGQFGPNPVGHRLVTEHIERAA